MRRTVALVVGVCTAMIGVTGATAYALTGDETATVVADRPAAPAGETTAATSTTSGQAVPKTAAVPEPARRQGGGTTAKRTETYRESIGTLEKVDQVLDYLEAGRTTTLHYPGASYVKPHLTRLLMLPGDYVTVSNPDGTEVHRIEADPTGGALDLATQALGGEAPNGWAMSVSGDTAVVELHTTQADPLGVRSTLVGYGVTIDKVARGFTKTERDRAEAARPGREESICGTDDKADAVCYKSKAPVAYERSKAVARLLINGTELCTSWRVGATNRLLTNNHCFTQSSEAYQTEVWFNYQCAQCGGDAVFKTTKVWGDKVLSTDRDLDYTLFTVDNFKSIEQYGYLQFDLGHPSKGDEVYIPQHPGGNPTSIAMKSDKDPNGTCAVDNPSYTGYAANSDISYYCDTEGGSSGSPVISRKTNKVIALHHFGGCPNSGVRIDLIHSRIKSQL